MLKRVLLSVALVSYPCYSYSESIQPYFGVTGNAAVGGHQWVMDNILPEPPGLDVNGVFYSYTPEKLTEDDFKVTVGNENTWSDTEDWSGNPGGIEVRKVIGLPNIPREAMGDGYIITEGKGTVNDATVIYTYKVDPCYDPQFDPNCPGYVTPVPVVPEIQIEIYDATEDDYVNLSDDEKSLIQENEEQLDKEKKEEEEEAEEKLRKYRLEKALAASDASALFAENQRIKQMNDAMQVAVDIQYVSATIPGGTYKEEVKLVDKQINDNKNGLRNGLAQQILHEEMVNMQYQN